MGKRYGWADVAGVVGRVIAPIAVKAETGRTVGELVAAGRRAAAGVPTVAPVLNAAIPVAVPMPLPAAATPALPPTTPVPDAPPQKPRRRTRAPMPTITPTVVPDATVPVMPKRQRKSATAALLAERVGDGADVFVRKGTRYVRCPDPARWNPADGSLYTRHGTGGQTRYTEHIPQRSRRRRGAFPNPPRSGRGAGECPEHRGHPHQETDRATDRPDPRRPARQ